jgi:hypothetical protein
MPTERAAALTEWVAESWRRNAAIFGAVQRSWFGPMSRAVAGAASSGAAAAMGGVVRHPAG